MFSGIFFVNQNTAVPVSCLSLEIYQHVMSLSEIGSLNSCPLYMVQQIQSYPILCLEIPNSPQTYGNSGAKCYLYMPFNVRTYYYYYFPYYFYFSCIMDEISSGIKQFQLNNFSFNFNKYTIFHS